MIKMQGNPSNSKSPALFILKCTLTWLNNKMQEIASPWVDFVPVLYLQLGRPCPVSYSYILPLYLTRKLFYQDGRLGMIVWHQIWFIANLMPQLSVN